MAKFSDNPMAGIVWDSGIITLGTLDANTAIQTPSKIDASREQGFRVLKTQYSMDIISKTDLEGPLMFGIQHNLSIAEVVEALAADPQASKGVARPENEEAMRPVWPLVAISRTNARQELPNWKEVKLLWSAPEGSSFNWFVWNSGAQLTTGASVSFEAKHFGVWLKD